MPLKYLVPSLLRVQSQTQSCPPHSTLTDPRTEQPGRTEAGAHPLHSLLAPILLSSRASAEKYHTYVAKLLAEEEVDGLGIDEQNILWFAYKHAKTDSDDRFNNPINEGGEDDAEERWQEQWLQRMEQREVMIQILLQLVLISLSPLDRRNGREPTSIHDDLPSPQKRKRTHRAQSPERISITTLEERLESLMDKLSMWQLMASIDKGEGAAPNSEALSDNERKGKKKAVDERDWMQVFCEDVVVPLFKFSLPSHCSLLQSKVFQSSPFSDDTDALSLSSTPPSSPKLKTKRLKPTASASASTYRQLPISREDGAKSGKSRGLSRSRSLSVSLQEERSRSQSISVEPVNSRKRALTREVSMTTAFKDKGKAKAQEAQRKTKLPARKIAAASSEKLDKNVGGGKGRTLVAATPVKPKAAHQSRSQSAVAHRETVDKLEAPNFLAHHTDMPVEGDEDEDQWIIQSSPDVLLLRSTDSQDSDGQRAA